MNARRGRRPHAAASAAALCLSLAGAPTLAAPGAPTPVASRPQAAPAAPAGAAAAFKGEPRAALDDVFGDATAYRRTVDRFGAIVDDMQHRRDDFARAVQVTLAQLSPGPDGNRPRGCPEEAIATPYARALRLGDEYLRAGRVLTRHYEEVRELDRLGETVGLTPDYRARVRRMVAQYEALLVDYREMKVAFHDQLTDELRYASCNLDRLVARADRAAAAAAATGAGAPATGASAGAGAGDAWPQPGQPGAPGVMLASERDATAVEASALPPTAAPVSRTSRTDGSGDGAATESAAPRSGIYFYVDNTRCHTGSHVSLDGHPLADVPAATRSGFQSTPGPHDLCLVPDGSTRRCGEAGTVRKSYLHEGWTISLRCE